MSAMRGSLEKWASHVACIGTRAREKPPLDGAASTGAFSDVSEMCCNVFPIPMFSPIRVPIGKMKRRFPEWISHFMVCGKVFQGRFAPRVEFST